MPSSTNRYLDDLAAEQAMLNRLYPTMAGEEPQAAQTPDQPNDKLIAQLAKDLEHPNVKAFLTTIAQAESSTYDSAYGDSTNTPNKFRGDEKYPGFGKNPSASGRYQIRKDTYNEVSKKLGLTDFSPKTQDLMAVYLITKRKAMDHIKRGDIDAALPEFSKEWAALPQGRSKGGYYEKQNAKHYNKAKSYDEVISNFELNRAP
jgi:muramidase (phage lysozyme)